MRCCESIWIDSRDRDLSKYPNASSYRVSIDPPLRGVSAVELAYAQYDTSGSDRYAVLEIDELSSGSKLSTSGGNPDAFAHLPMTAPSAGINEFLGASGTYPCFKYLSVPLEVLDRLTVRFATRDGGDYPVSEHVIRIDAYTSCRRFSP